MLSGCLQATETIKVILSGVINDVTQAAKEHSDILKEHSDILKENNKKTENIDENNENEKRDNNDKNNENSKCDKNSNDNTSDNNGSALKKIKIKNEINSNISPLIGRQILYDAASGEFHNFILPARNENCAVCGVEAKILNMNDCENDLKSSAAVMEQVRLLKHNNENRN